MDSFTQSDLTQLLDVESTPKVTIYAPTVRAGREVRQNATRFANSVREAHSRLIAQGTEQRQADALLETARQLESDNDFWQHQGDVLAVFIADGFFRNFRLAAEPEEKLTVGPRFFVRPLARLLQDNGRFYVLAVSQNRVRLLEGNQYGLDEREVDGLPTDLQSALNIDEFRDHLDQHTTAGPAGAGDMLFHGQGGSSIDVKKRDELLEFFRRIDRALDSFFGNDRIPLLFAGVEYEFSLFREASQYETLVDQPITGNPDQASEKELHRQAWEIMQPRLAGERDRAVQQWEQAVSNDRSIAKLEQVVLAARQQAIQTLLVAERQEHWGVVDEEVGSVVTADPENAGAEELLNYAAARTLGSGGSVYTLPAEKVPGSQGAAALLRYPSNQLAW
jgi:hypothetical protein